MADGLVWYVSYGSNMAADRLACYLEGGCPPGGSRRNPGARDTTPPLRSRAVDLPGTTYFAGRSPQWGGGVAFYDHATPGRTAARAYLVTAAQLADIAAQEMYRVPADGDPIEQLVLDPLDGGRHEVGPGHYETLVEVGEADGHPLLTFTAPHGADAVEHTRPADAYLAVMATGLRESRGWSADEVAAYLASLQPGLDPRAALNP
ncbi:histone deacetylase [Nocardioides abyssi]|uniref:Histone deacetylase n=1 Tax=Nocardioides abyssi TaxID=3058370 RepID=A0ABT8EX36_9ACTN|nr:histone deacetylase [Nocardioides abyssi]MDN4162624.1 histone deacetylase [Nocardioides abyssi]